VEVLSWSLEYSPEKEGGEDQLITRILYPKNFLHNNKEGKRIISASKLSKR
jgi:hypothetical protein